MLVSFLNVYLFLMECMHVCVSEWEWRGGRGAEDPKWALRRSGFCPDSSKLYVGLELRNQSGTTHKPEIMT